MADTNRSAIVKEFLKYTFSGEEMHEFATELARKTAEITEAEESKKAAVAQFGDRIASLRADTSSLARKFNSGYEHRNIECRVTYHDPQPAQKTTVRLDTGEIVKVQAMSFGELQEILPFVEAAAEAADEKPEAAPDQTEDPTDAVAEPETQTQPEGDGAQPAAA